MAAGCLPVAMETNWAEERDGILFRVKKNCL